VTLTPNLRGALWMLASAAGFTVMTTLIKFLGPGYPAALQTFYRQLAGVVVLLPLMARDWRAAFRTTRPGILIFRSSAGVLALIMSFYAYQKLPLADANALSFTRTLWLVPLAAFVLREPIGPWRIGAALVGFVGVMIMLRPGAGGGADGLEFVAQTVALDQAVAVVQRWLQDVAIVNHDKGGPWRDPQRAALATPPIDLARVDQRQLGAVGHYAARMHHGCAHPVAAEDFVDARG